MSRHPGGCVRPDTDHAAPADVLAAFADALAAGNLAAARAIASEQAARDLDATRTEGDAT